MYNGIILTIAKNLKHIMASAEEAEIGGIFFNMKNAAILRTTLEEL